MISKANVKNIYLLTPLQEGMLFHDLYRAGESYFEQLSYRVQGRLDIPLFRQAWDELVRRHDVLRTVFVTRDVPRPLQLVLKEWRIDFHQVDLRRTPAEQVANRLTELKEADRAKPFNLARDPLTRIAVFLLADDEAEVVWSHHHIILDGWSAGILQGELLEIYAALAGGRRHALPEPVPFATYVSWIGKQDQQGSLRFWQEYLAGFSQATGVPRLPRCQPVSGGRGALLLPVERRRSEGLTALAAAQGVTLNVLLQALWGLLLCRLNGVDEAVFAATVSGRPESLRGIESMVGLFINAVPVRVGLGGSVTLPELLRTLQGDTLAASRHHWCSLADIQAQSPLKQGLLDHILIFENYPLDERLADQSAGRDFAVVGAEMRENSHYPFELAIMPGQQLQFKLGYDRAVYEPEQIERLAWSLEQLIADAVEQPQAPLAALSILSPRERAQILTVFNRPQGAAAAETVADVLERRAAQDPDRLALIFGESTFTYRALNEAANKVAHRLQQQCGVRPDEVVGVLMNRSERLLAALLGIIKAGAAYLPLDPAFPAARIAYMLEDSRCRVLLTEQRHRGGLAGIDPEAVIIELDQLPEGSPANPPRSTRPEHLLYLIYTSGSTGRPKGVLLEQRNVLSFNRNMMAVYGLAPGDAILALTTITFDISVLELICSLMSGLTVVLASDAVANDPARAVGLLRQGGVNVLQITPSRLKLMLEETDLSALSGLKALLVGGEPLSEALCERLRGLPGTALFNVYGPTEATIWSTSARLNDAPLTIGTPLLDEEVLPLSSTGELVPVGVWGEICIGGQGLARGYWNRPELTAERFIPHPLRAGERLYRTGDLGRFLPDGTLQCGGRMDNQVKVRGFRIETGEIEQNLLQIPGIREAVVHVVEMDGLNEIAAYLVPTGERMPPVAELRKKLALALPDYMLPSHYLTLERIPLTPNGKTDRQALPLPMAATAGGAPDGRSFVPPRNATEAVLAAIWQRLLGVEQVGINDNFFDLGGHSIKAIRIASAIAKELKREVPLALIFEHPTPAALAVALGDGAAAQAELAPLAAREAYRTSPGQQRLWLLQQLAPASAAYNMALALKLTGTVDPAALRRAFADLALRHEALRTLFPQPEALPVQVVLPGSGELLAVVDLRAEAHPWEEALRQAHRQASTPFELATGPLCRTTFFHAADDGGLLLVVMHHIVGDGWSWGILLRELAERYRLQRAGGALPPAPLPVQYKEWAQYQQQALAAGDWEPLRRYWHAALAEPPVPLALPTDLPRPALRRDGGGSVSATLAAATVAALRELARAHDATLFMVLLALLKTLLHRLGGQQQITVGIPVAGRPLPQLEGVVGFFVNTLALRSRIEPHGPFSELLSRVRRTALDGYAHQLYPFDLLVGELALPRDTGHAPLFDVMLVLQEEMEDLPSFDGLRVDPVPLSAGTSRFDLTFNFTPCPSGLTLELEYATDLFYPETAQRIAQRFLQLAAAVAASPHAPLHRLDLLPAAERAALQACGRGAAQPWPREKSMIDLFRDQVLRCPEAVAVVATDRTLSYAELDRLSDQCARHLRDAHQLKKEEAVGVMTGRGASLPVALLGVMKAGGTYLPIDADQPHSRLRHIVADSGLRTILVDAETVAQVVGYGDLGSVLEVVFVDGKAGDARARSAPQPEGEERIGVVLTRRLSPTAAVDERSPAAGELPLRGGEGEGAGAAYIIYTSGSTGRPKGVLLQHGGFVNMILDQIRTFGITPADRCLLFSSFAFDGAMSEIFLALHSGAALVLARREEVADPLAFSRLLQQTATTVATLPPVYLNALRSAGVRLDPLRIIITAGEAAITADVLHYAREITLFNAYGPTEASVCSTIHRVDPSRPYHGTIPIGAPMANSELLLLDAELQLVPFGVVGEICLAGPGLARGYLHHPELTSEAFVPHPSDRRRRLYRSGDMGRRLADGAVQFLGRRDEQVKVRGFRIECGEVEAALLQLPEVDGAVVVARGEGMDKELVAYLLARGEPAPAALKTELAKQLPAFMLPTRFVLLDAFPQNANGKVDRNKLAAADLGRELPTGGGDEPPATAMERRLAVVWEEVLGRREIRRHDSFFEIGGQSIAAIRVAAAIGEKLGIRLPLSAIFQQPILAELALECERTAAFADGYQESPHHLLHRGDRGAIFAFPPISGYPVAYRRLAESLEDVDFHGFSFIEADDLLQRYAESIRQLQPHGPLTLLGYSSGGNLAFEVAKELERQGRTVSELILLDSWKRLPGAPVTEKPQEWVDDHLPDPALYGNLAELMESPHIRELAFGKLRRYLAYIESRTTQGRIGAAIHLLRAENAGAIEGLSQEWADHTAGVCIVHSGSGPHLSMLMEPWVKGNAQVVKNLLGERGTLAAAEPTSGGGDAAEERTAFRCPSRGRMP